MHIFSIGEVLWDVFREREILGGAPLNFCVTAQRLGNVTSLLTAVGNDPRGQRAINEIRALGLDDEFIQTTALQPTGTAIVQVNEEGNTNFTIARPAAFDCIEVSEQIRQRIADFAPDWVYFGTLAQARAECDERLEWILQAVPRARRFYDMNLRTEHWNLPLVEHLSSLADVVKLNDAEATMLAERTLGIQNVIEQPDRLEAFSRDWTQRHGIATLCITLGADGCAIYNQDQLSCYAGYPVQVVDTVGAGDAFAAAFLHGMHAQWPIDRTAHMANALGALIASRPGATPPWQLEECLRLIARR